MARVTHVKHAQQRYRTVPVLNEDGTRKTVQVMRRNGEPKLTKRGHPVFQRQSASDKSQPLPNRHCERCGVEIKVGDPYKWVKPKSGPYGGHLRVRCAPCPTWRQSELSSSKMADIYALQEEIDEIAMNCESNDDLISAAEDAANRIRDVAEQYREAAQNIEEGFGHPTYQSEELEQKAEELVSWADEIEGLDFAEFQPGECDHRDADSDADSDVDECDACSEGQLLEDSDQWNEEMEDHMDEQRTLLTDAVSECPV